MNKRLDVCIVNYNTPIHIERLLNYLNPQEDSVFNVYIADNGSAKDSVDFLCKYKELHPAVELVFNANVGYARACNQLAAMGNSDYIALCNADIWMTNQDVESIIKTMDENPVIGILGPKQRDEFGQITAGGIFGVPTMPKHRGWKEHDPDDVLYRDRAEAVTVSGSAYFIRRSIWDELSVCPVYKEMEVCKDSEMSLGAFLPTPHYYRYEETFASYHAKSHGYKVFYDGTVSIGHSFHASHPIGSRQDKMFRESQEIFRKACSHHGIACD